MNIFSDLIPWNGPDFPGEHFLSLLKRNGYNVISYGTITRDTKSSKDLDCYIQFTKDGDNTPCSIQFNKESNKFVYFKGVKFTEGKDIVEFENFIKSGFNPIYSFTLKELRDAEDMNFIHRKEHLEELDEPSVLYAYANTLVMEIKSSQYGKKIKEGTISTKYKIFVLFEDFYTIGKDKDINFEDAIDYAIDFGDIHIRCNCPAFLYYGDAYMSTQMRYLYGVPRENRFPKIRNPNLKGTMCKHCDKVVDWILKHKDIVGKLFATYYNRLNDGQSIYAVNTNGTTITIGKKNEEGDIFFERQVPEEMEEEMINNEIPEEEIEQEETDETIDPMDPDTWWDESEEDNVIESE